MNIRRRIALAAVGVAFVTLVYTLVYQWAMGAFAGENITLIQALQSVVEIVTTAGFGGDTDAWNRSDAMALIVVFMNASAVLLVFVAIPLFVVPMMREAFETDPPESSDLTDHVIICGHSPRDEVLSDELENAEIPYLYIDNDRELVSDLVADGINAMYGDSERVDTFRAANAEAARAVVADINDEVNPTVILSAARANPAVDIVSVVRETEAETYHRFAGAHKVVEGPQVLGESLGMRAVTSFAEKFRATLDVDSELEVTELLVEENSDLVGQTLRETDVFDRMGVTVVGGWFDGKFVVSPGPKTTIEENTILLVAGEYENFVEVKARPLPAHRDDPDRVVVCGYGVVGRAVAETLRLEGIDFDVVDLDPSVDPDVVGDVTDPETLVEAGVENARAVVLALNEDTTTIYATLVLEQLVPDVEIIARVHDPDNVWKLYNAGADFVLSMSVVTGEMLAAELIEDQEILTPQSEFEFVRTKAPALAGRSIGEVDVRARTGCTIVAVERGDELLTDLGPGFVVEDGDVLVVSGDEDATAAFVEFVH